MILSTTNKTSIEPFLRKIYLPKANSHKGQNGKVLVIGGSSLFHGAVLWAAEATSSIVDMVHVASTKENNEIIQKIKTLWQAGIVVAQKDIPHYAQEDNVILVGNGLMRTEDRSQNTEVRSQKWEDVLKIKYEGRFTREAVFYLIAHFPEKQFVFDAGALQMMDADWLKLLHKKALITPHQKEFQTLFHIDLTSCSLSEKVKIVQQTARTYNCIILLKTIDDIISDGHTTIQVHGGNAGLTKGGTGDILAGLVSGMSALSDPFFSSIVASYILKLAAEELFQSKGYWYTTKDLLIYFPSVFHSLTKGTSGV